MSNPPEIDDVAVVDVAWIELKYPMLADICVVLAFPYMSMRDVVALCPTPG